MRFIALSDQPGWHVDDLRRAAMARGHTIDACSWLALTGRVGMLDAPDSPIDSADAILVRTMPPGTLEQVIFRMDALHRLTAGDEARRRRGTRVINRPRAIEIAVDKYLALARIESAGLPVPATIACQLYSDAMQAFDELGRDVVVKSLFGSEGFGMTRISDRDLAARAFMQLERMGNVIYLQRFIDHGGTDLRLFVIDGHVIAAMRRTSSGWRTNVARGGKPEAIETTSTWRDMAIRATAACEATVAGVDLVIDQAGQPFVLEVNAAPGWRAISSVTGVDVADRIIALAEREVQQ